MCMHVVVVSGMRYVVYGMRYVVYGMCVRVVGGVCRVVCVVLWCVFVCECWSLWWMVFVCAERVCAALWSSGMILA